MVEPVRAIKAKRDLTPNLDSEKKMNSRSVTPDGSKSPKMDQCAIRRKRTGNFFDDAKYFAYWVSKNYIRRSVFTVLLIFLILFLFAYLGSHLPEAPSKPVNGSAN